MITAKATQSSTTYPYFTDEHQMLRDSVKQFVQAEIAPHAEEWDEAGIFPKEVFKQCANLGLFGIRLDPTYGGSGLDCEPGIGKMARTSFHARARLGNPRPTTAHRRAGQFECVAVSDGSQHRASLA